MMQMMMIGDPPRSNPTVQIPPWDCRHADDPTAHIQSPGDGYESAMAALQRYLPSNIDDDDDFDAPADAFSCDDFRMFEFKVKRCARVRSHDWTQCPFAHPGEKARRRDPRRYHYSGTPCPGFRRGACRRGDSCEFAHGVFECWLHPARYRTQPCKDGTNCRRRVCFFAHTPDQLRLFTSPDGSPGRPGPEPIPLCGSFPNSAFYSPPSSPLTGSPPVSPSGALGVSQLTESMRDLQLNKMKSGLGPSMSPPSWGFGFGSPRSPTEPVRAGFRSLPSTPVRAVNRSGLNPFDAWEEEEPVMERVESGRALREKLYSKLGKENSLDRCGGRTDPASADPDVGWVSELLN